MSALLPNDGPLQLEDGEWLPPNMLVQLIHGQHRKAVLESVIATHAQWMKATMGGLLPTQSDIQSPVQEGPLDSAMLAEVHQNPDAWWNVRLYGQCKP